MTICVTAWVDDAKHYVNTTWNLLNTRRVYFKIKMHALSKRTWLRRTKLSSSCNPFNKYNINNIILSL